MGETVPIEAGELLARVKAMRDGGYRLVQVHCVQATQWEFHYSFDRDYRFVTLKLASPERPELPSISDFYPSAYLYENEMHELYGVIVTGMSIDYRGHLYEGRTAEAFVRPPSEGGDRG